MAPVLAVRGGSAESCRSSGRRPATLDSGRGVEAGVRDVPGRALATPSQHAIRSSLLESVSSVNNLQLIQQPKNSRWRQVSTSRQLPTVTVPDHIKERTGDLPGFRNQSKLNYEPRARAPVLADLISASTDFENSQQFMVTLDRSVGSHPAQPILAVLVGTLVAAVTPLVV